MKDIFIADAHLRHPEDENYRRLLQFLDNQGDDLRTLYLVGDIFEFWVGYRHTVFAAYVPLLASLQRLRRRGVEMVFVEGNHDFRVGPYFTETLGCQVLPDGGALQLDDLRLYLCHGDLINPHDRGYRILRRVLRSRLVSGLIALVPPDWTWGIARWASRQSQQHRTKKEHNWSPHELFTEFAKERFSAGFDIAVTGHFHTPWRFEADNGLFIALGDWISQYSYLVYSDGQFTLENY